MSTRRDFLKLGALWLPAMATPRVAYSFLRGSGLPSLTFNFIEFPPLLPKHRGFTYRSFTLFVNGVRIETLKNEIVGKP